MLAVELEHMTLKPGDRFDVIAHYQGLMGDRLTIAESPLLFALPRGRSFEILRHMKIREIPLRLSVKVILPGTDKNLRFEVVEVNRGPTPLEFFRQARPELPTLATARRLTILRWALATGKALRIDTLFEEAHEDMLDAVETNTGLFQ